MVKVTLADPNEVSTLMTAEQYEAFLAKERA
jgi:glycine cleavage system H lipoate-binding protein